MSIDNPARRVLDFWFGVEGSGTFGKSRPEWFMKDSVFDQAIGDAFLRHVEAAIGGSAVIGEDRAADCLARIILLDQFPRNLFRGQARSFAGDEQALAAAGRAIARGFDAEMPPFQRIFFYLPFEHSESITDQRRSVELFRRCGDDVAIEYAIAHHDIIARFGRFPHRNVTLGRTSTAAELAFLEGPNSSF